MCEEYLWDHRGERSTSGAGRVKGSFLEEMASKST